MTLGPSDATNQATRVRGAGLLTGIHLAGAGTNASIATAKAFLIEILARG
jgi:hypothetical protein